MVRGVDRVLGQIFGLWWGDGCGERSLKHKSLAARGLQYLFNPKILFLSN